MSELTTTVLVANAIIERIYRFDERYVRFDMVKLYLSEIDKFISDNELEIKTFTPENLDLKIISGVNYSSFFTFKDNFISLKDNITVENLEEVFRETIDYSVWLVLTSKRVINNSVAQYLCPIEEEARIIEDKKYWIIDTNKWSKERYTREEALEMSKEMIKCIACVDCYKCKNCVQCVNLHKSNNCVRCEWGHDNYNCVESNFCSHCSHCDNCHGCCESSHLRDTFSMRILRGY